MITQGTGGIAKDNRKIPLKRIKSFRNLPRNILGSGWDDPEHQHLNPHQMQREQATPHTNKDVLVKDTEHLGFLA